MDLPAAFKRIVPLPENRSALIACQDLALGLNCDSDPLPNPLYLHGPSGVGKSCLVADLLDHVCCENASGCLLSGNDFPLPWDKDMAATATQRYQDALTCDLLVVEDLQHLPARATETFVQLLDERLTQQLAIVVTASGGPAMLDQRGLPLPARLANRLAGGLTIALAALQPPSRLLLLQELARRRQLDVDAEVLAWLADALHGGGRQLEGALHQLATLGDIDGQPPSLAVVHEHFHAQVEAARPTIERIMRRVGDFYRIEPRQLRSARRHQKLMLPRQISMYLARRLTNLTLKEVGACFGGRDHTTVLHACRSVEQVMAQDVVTDSCVHQMFAELA